MKTEQEINQARMNLELNLLAQQCTLAAIKWVLDMPGGERFQKFIMDNTTTALAQNANDRNS